MADAKKGTCKLTPKNVYRCLTYKQHSGRSNNIFTGKLTNMTLIRFWSELLAPVLPAETLESLFATEEKRSRKLSDLMNRTGSWSLPRDLEGPLFAALNPQSFLRLQRSCMDFLRNNLYVYTVFRQELSAFINDCIVNDDVITPGIAAFLTNLMSDSGISAHVAQSFADGYNLAWVCLLSLFGDQMQSHFIVDLMMMRDCSCAALWDRYSHLNYGRFTPSVISSRHSLLCRMPLPVERLAGRQAELNKLCSKLQNGGKVVVTGMGGIGKSELVRQAVRRLEEYAVFNRLAYVQYEGPLASSYKLSFREYENDPGILVHVRGLLQNQSDGNTLLLIDNMDNPASDGEALAELASYGCSVVITSRSVVPDGFEEMHLKALAPDAAMQVFHDHAGRTLADAAGLADLLELADGHPIALALMGSLCKVHHIKPDELKEQLLKDGFLGLNLTRDTSAKKLLDVLAGLWRNHALDDDAGRLLALFSTFPTLIWPFAVLQQVLADLGTPFHTGEMLTELAARGWLEENGDAYYMHPLIAEHFQRTTLTWKEFPKLLAWVSDYVHQDIKISTRRDPMLTPLCIAVLSRIKGEADTLPILLCTFAYDNSCSLIDRAVSMMDEHTPDVYRLWVACEQAFTAEMKNDLQLMKRYAKEAAALSCQVKAFLPAMVDDVVSAVNSAFNCGELQSAQTLLAHALERTPHCPQRVELQILAQITAMQVRDIKKSKAHGEQALVLIDEFKLQGTLYDADASGYYARLCSTLQDPEQGIPHAVRALRMWTDWLGSEDHVLIGITNHLIGTMRLLLGETDQARADIEHAIQILNPKMYGPIHPAIAKLSLAYCIATTGEADHALCLAREALVTITSAIPDSLPAANAYDVYGKVCAACGKTDEAIEALNTALTIWQNKVGPDILDTARIEVRLCEVLMNQGQTDHIAAKLDHAYQILLDQLGENHRNTIEAKALLDKLA